MGESAAGRPPSCFPGEPLARLRGRVCPCSTAGLKKNVPLQSSCAVLRHSPADVSQPPTSTSRPRCRGYCPNPSPFLATVHARLDDETRSTGPTGPPLGLSTTEPSRHASSSTPPETPSLEPVPEPGARPEQAWEYLLSWSLGSPQPPVEEVQFLSLFGIGYRTTGLATDAVGECCSLDQVRARLRRTATACTDTTITPGHTHHLQ